MAKFKVNQKVVRNSDGKIGVVKAREMTCLTDSNENKKVTSVKYLVDFGEGIENWSIVTRNDISSVKDSENYPYVLKFYDIDDKKKLTMVALVEKVRSYVCDYDDLYSVKKTTGKKLSIGFSIYNGVDEFNPIIGEKIAIHRCKKNPFTTMSSDFSGEFNDQTIEAIMNAKADYIIANIDNFYRPE